MKTHLDFYMNNWVSEWDSELAELVTVSDLCDIKEHKTIILRQLTQIVDMFIVEAAKGEQEDLINLLDTMMWLTKL
jgi:hypothetical protein